MSSLRAFFLDVQGSHRFCLLHEPSKTRAPAGAVLFVHPFAEEMNLSRRMAAIQSRAFRDAGFTVLQMDLHGCGDSAGGFEDATWEGWIADIQEAARWLHEYSGRDVALWGLRAGCLLCAQVAARNERPPPLILWQPVLSGKQHLQQFLRLKIAHDIVGDPITTTRKGTQFWREQLAAGLFVEVAGYVVSPALAAGMDAASLDIPDGQAPVCWIEVTGARDAKLGPVSVKYIDSLAERTRRIEARAVHGPAFWQNPGSDDCHALVEATLAGTETWARP